MDGGKIAALLFFSVSLAHADADFSTSLRITTAAGVSVPALEGLARKLDAARGNASGVRTLVREGGRVVEVQRPKARHPRSAVVRSFDAATGIAYLHVVEYPEYRMPLLQRWRFDGKEWSDSVDSGIFVKAPRRPR
jgi:hypothetical protein